jgi:hypothetical protein
MTSHAERKLEEVEEKIEKLKARNYELLEKEILTKREEYELKNFEEELNKLEADKERWLRIIEKSIL